MQEHGGDEATDAIVAAERRFFVELKVDWNRTGNYGHALSDLSRYADNIQTDRSLAGSAPAELMLIEGASAAELTFDIGGEQDYEDYLNFVAVFSPYNGLSPMYNLDPIGCEVTYRIGIDTAIGIVWYPQFVGNIRTITPNRDTNTVTFSALDRVEKLRVPVQFPVWAISDYNSQRGYELAQLMNSQWVIDHCLRFGDTSPTPYRPMYEHEFTRSDPERDKGIRFWLTGTGGHTPSVGSMDENTSQGFPDVENGSSPMFFQNGLPHPDSPEPTTPPLALSSLGGDDSGWGTGGNYGSSYMNRYWALDRNTDNINSAHYIGFTLTETGTDGDWWRQTDNATSVVECYLGFHIKAVITLYQGSIRAEIRNYLTTGGVVSSWYAVPAADFSTVAVKLGIGGGGSAATKYWILVNGVQLGTGTLADWTSYMDGNFDPYTGYVDVKHQAGFNDVFWGNRWSGSTLTPTDADFGTLGGRREASYAAVLDVGNNYLTYLPATSADDAWSTITAVASAELGSVFWDESGVFHFWKRDRIIDLQSSPVRTMTLDDVEGLQITNSLDSIRNVITAESKRSTAGTTTVWESSSIDDFYIPATTRKYFIFYPTNIEGVYPLQIPRYRTSETLPLTLPLWDDNVLQGYVAQWDNSGTWQEQNDYSDPEVHAYMNEDGSLTIEIYNGHPRDMRIATGDAGESSSAAFKLGGSAVSQNQTAILSTMDRDSIDKYGRRNYPMSGDWVQWQPAVADQLVDFVLPRTIAPIPTTDAVTIAGDPRLQLGDCIEVIDQNGMGELMQMQIYGIQRNYSRDTGLTDTLTVEMIQPPRIGIWDSPQYGLWDETFIWSD